MIEQHISDDRLIEICITRPAAGDDQVHLSSCPRCEGRRVEIVEILAELDDAATQDAGAAFPPTRLDRQHARILQRVDHDGRPGLVVAFPTSQPAQRRFMPTRPRVRWAAAAAAAAFVAGVLTGRVTHNFTLADERQPVRVVANEGQLPLRAVPTTFSEDAFLDELEVAGSQNGPAALRPLDAMTPSAWEVR